MNTKPKSQFAFLPEEDRKLVLDLCSAHTYDQAVDLLRKPRAEGGLAINTSRSALSRFYINSNPEPARALLAQFAAAANIRHEQHSSAFLGTIRATIHAHIFQQLHSGKSLAAMEKDFRFLKTAEHLYLADARFRADHPETARANYKEYVQRCAETSDVDFILVDESEPNTPTPHLEDFTKSEHDIAKERECLLETLAILQKAGVQPDPIPLRVSSKTPAIPHFSRNPTIETRAGHTHLTPISNPLCSPRPPIL